MAELASLWLPILVASAGVWFASFVCWALSPHHQPDWQKFDKEDDVMDLVKNASPGQYMFPFVKPEELKDPDMKARYEAGPHGTLNVWKSGVNMGRNMVLTFATFLVVSVFIGYLASIAMDPGAAWMPVFRFTGTAGVLAYCFAYLPNDIWFGTPRRAITMNMLDGLLFGIVTGIAFASLWPAATA